MPIGCYVMKYSGECTKRTGRHKVSASTSNWKEIKLTTARPTLRTVCVLGQAFSTSDQFKLNYLIAFLSIHMPRIAQQHVKHCTTAPMWNSDSQQYPAACVQCKQSPPSVCQPRQPEFRFLVWRSLSFTCHTLPILVNIQYVIVRVSPPPPSPWSLRCVCRVHSSWQFWDHGEFLGWNKINITFPGYHACMMGLFLSKKSGDTSLIPSLVFPSPTRDRCSMSIADDQYACHDGPFLACVLCMYVRVYVCMHVQ